MGSVLKAIVAITVVIIVTVLPVATAILATLSDSFEGFISDQFEIVFGLFGIEDEDVVVVEVHDQLLFSDSTDVQSMLTQVAITHAKTDKGIIQLLSENSNRIRGAYSNYFNNGDSEFSPGLPTTNLQANVVPSAAIKAVIDAQYTVSSTIVNAYRKVPTKEEYVYSVLFDLYGYKLSSNTMTYNGVAYKVTDINYNFTTNNYDVNISRDSTKRTTTTIVVTPLNEVTNTAVTTTTTVTVTNIDPSNDNVNTVVTEQTVVTGVVSGVLSDNTIEVSNTNEVVAIGTVVDSVTSDLVETPGTNYYADNVNTTVVVEQVLVEGTILISTTVTDEVVPIGTVVDSVTVVEVADSYEPLVLSYLAPLPVHHYVVNYYTTDMGDTNYWVYEIGSGVQPTLDNASTYITNLEMLPVVSLRNNKVSITQDKQSQEYLEAKDILSTIGLDPDLLLEGIEDNPDIANIESAHIHFGVDPRVSDPVVAKALFTTFDYIYDDADLFSDDTSSYLATMIEGKYNASLTWKEFDRTINAGVIAGFNECTNDVIQKTVNGEVIDVLRIRKQTAPEFYTEYQLTYLLSTTFIKSGGFANASSGTLSEGTLIIPISKFFIDSLTGLEQMALFSKSLRLSVYTIDVQHLRYYETAAFSDFIEIVMIVVAIIIFIFTWYTGGATAAAFYAAVQSLLVAFAVSYAFTLLLESTDNKLARAVLAAAAIVALAYAGKVDGIADIVFLSANLLTQSVMIDVRLGMEKLEAESYRFQSILKKRQEAAEEAEKKLKAGMSTADVTDLSRVNPNVGYVEGIDAFMYRAKGSIQYDYGLLFDYSDKTTGMYDDAFRLDLNKSLS